MTYAEVDAGGQGHPRRRSHITLDEALQQSHDAARHVRRGRPACTSSSTRPRAIEGMPRHASTHAAGVVITEQPVYDYVPLASNDDALVTPVPR